MSSRVFCLRLRVDARPRRELAFEQVLLPFATLNEVQYELRSKGRITGQMLFTRLTEGQGREVYDMTPQEFLAPDVTGIFVPVVPLILAPGIEA